MFKYALSIVAVLFFVYFFGGVFYNAYLIYQHDAGYSSFEKKTIDFESFGYSDISLSHCARVSNELSGAVKFNGFIFDVPKYELTDAHEVSKYGETFYSVVFSEGEKILFYKSNMSFKKTAFGSGLNDFLSKSGEDETELYMLVSDMSKFEYLDYVLSLTSGELSLIDDFSDTLLKFSVLSEKYTVLPDYTHVIDKIGINDDLGLRGYLSEGKEYDKGMIYVIIYDENNDVLYHLNTYGFDREIVSCILKSIRQQGETSINQQA